MATIVDREYDELSAILSPWINQAQCGRGLDAESLREEDQETLRQLHSGGVTAAIVLVWRALGVSDLKSLQRVLASGVTVREARRWHAAGLNANFAAAAAQCGASLDEVLELTSAYQQDCVAAARALPTAEELWLALGERVRKIDWSGERHMEVQLGDLLKAPRAALLHELRTSAAVAAGDVAWGAPLLSVFPPPPVVDVGLGGGIFCQSGDVRTEWRVEWRARDEPAEQWRAVWVFDTEDDATASVYGRRWREARHSEFRVVASQWPLGEVCPA